jgi:hypothetical protein
MALRILRDHEERLCPGGPEVAPGRHSSVIMKGFMPGDPGVVPPASRARDHGTSVRAARARHSRSTFATT